jgi:hypothetical protein
MGVPIYSPPALLLPDRYETFNQRTRSPSPACFRPNEEILKIADRSEAPGVEVEDIIGETNRCSLARTGEQAPHGLIGREDAMPHAFGDRVRHVTAESCAVAVPEREPGAVIIGSRRANAQVGGHG